MSGLEHVAENVEPYRAAPVRLEPARFRFEAQITFSEALLPVHSAISVGLVAKGTLEGCGSWPPVLATCASAVGVIGRAAITSPLVARRVRCHIAARSEPLPLAPARPPPQEFLSFA